MAVSEAHEGVMPLWAGVFPFVGDFKAVVDGTVSFSYVDAMRGVLRSVVDATGDVHAGKQWSAFSIRTTIAAVVALQRCELVVQNQGLLKQVESEEDGLCVAEYLDEVWELLAERDGLVYVDLDWQVSRALDTVVSGVWRYCASACVTTLADLYSQYALLLNGVRVREIAGVWVEAIDGRLVSDIGGAEALKPLIPLDTYRIMVMAHREQIDGGVRVSFGGESRYIPLVNGDEEAVVLDIGFGCVSLSVVLDWIWILTEFSKLHNGTCYLLLYPPGLRRRKHLEFGSFPTVESLLQSAPIVWTTVLAEVESRASDLHVINPGYCDLLAYPLHLRVGTDSDEDLYAKALLDGFIAKHKKTEELVRPVDSRLVPMTVDTSVSAGPRRFSFVADVLYESVGKALSPGSRGSVARGKLDYTSAPDKFALDVDDERLASLQERLADGGAIDEGYFHDTLRRRFSSRWRPRPRLHESGGRGMHVFSGFPASGGAGVGVWIKDEQWTVPGWTSYLARFRRGIDETLSFVSPVDAVDIRMDITGMGEVDFGGCKVTADTTVIWFSNTVKFRLVTKSSVDIRISVPDSGQSLAIGLNMRRYLRVNGYVVAMRSYDVYQRVSCSSFSVHKSSMVVGAGCQVYLGAHYYERGKHRIRITGLSSSSPVKLLVASEPVNALGSVEWCGIRVYSTPLDYAGLLIENVAEALSVLLQEEAMLKFSLLQVVDINAYDVAVRASQAVTAVS